MKVFHFETFRDVLNHVYFNKRKLYLAALSEVLTAAGFCGSIEVSNFKSDSRKPFLILKPQFKTKYTVHLYVCAPNAVFKLVQLLPSKNNVRPDWWMKELQVKRSESEPTGSSKKSGKKAANSSSNGDRSSDPAALAPTPHYNMAILEDLAVMPQYHMLMKASEACPCFVDVCILLKVRDSQISSPHLCPTKLLTNSSYFPDTSQDLAHAKEPAFRYERSGRALHSDRSRLLVPDKENRSSDHEARSIPSGYQLLSPN